jgi:hypothetical protein
MNKILRGICKIWKLLPLVQMPFLWLKQNSPSINSPLSVQEGFKTSNFENTTCSPFRTQGDTNLKFTNWKSLIFKIRVVVRSFCFGLGWWCGPFALGSYFLPLWHESPKTDTLSEIEARWQLFSPLWQIKHMSEDYTEDGEWSGAMAKDE